MQWTEPEKKKEKWETHEWNDTWKKSREWVAKNFGERTVEMSGTLLKRTSFSRSAQKSIAWSDRQCDVTKMRDNRDDGNNRGGLRYRYCVIVGQHSKMEMVALLNGPIVSHNPLTRSSINSIHTRDTF